jgi:pimeloyl-ACP methyl ester carboxylesterase
MAGQRLSANGWRVGPVVGLSFALCVLPALAACSPSAAPSPTPATINGAVKVNGVALHYEITGQGEPLILIGGLGTATWLWWKQVPEASKDFRVIAYDQRGIGWSDKPDEPYTIPMLADDLAGLMDALRIKQAHVLGISLGGYVAQEFALKYPERVKRLVLCSTSIGGVHAIPPAPDMIVALLTPVAGQDDLRERVALSVSPACAATHPEDIDKMVAWRLDNPQPAYAYNRQLMSSVGWTSEGRLGQIIAPTMVLAGTADTVVPPGNAELLAEGIPHAELRLLEGAGHLINVEQADEFNQEVIRFLTWK